MPFWGPWSAGNGQFNQPLDPKVQREHNYAIVDEADNIFIDEARTPLIISGPAEEANKLYTVFAALAKHLVAAPKPEEGEDPDPNADAAGWPWLTASSMASA